MSHVILVGAQWGDEGKGKIVDWLCERADIVVRFQGGHNAGHTLVIDGHTYKLSLLPSGIVRPGKLSLIGNGVVIHPEALLHEMETLRAQGVSITPENLQIAENAVLILPFHHQMDRADEAQRGSRRIGTTGRGIGPAYEDKVARRAIRMADLLYPEVLLERLHGLVDYHNAMRRGLGDPSIELQEVYDGLLSLTPILAPFIAPTWKILHEAISQGKRVLYEGAQGVMLDVDHGTYPYVTASSTVSGQAWTGSGTGPKAEYVLGIAKAYTTRVGSGPFPTEMPESLAEQIVVRGAEFGTVTGRKRRCGWIDATLLRQAAHLTGMHGIALTKLDVLDGMDRLQIGIGYRIDGKVYDYLPAAIAAQERAEPIYETLPGWQQSTRGVRRLEDLPAEALAYIHRIEALVGTKIAILSTSPERDDTILMHDPFMRS